MVWPKATKCFKKRWTDVCVRCLFLDSSLDETEGVRAYEHAHGQKANLGEALV